MSNIEKKNRKRDKELYGIHEDLNKVIREDICVEVIFELRHTGEGKKQIFLRREFQGLQIY